MYKGVRWFWAWRAKRAATAQEAEAGSASEPLLASDGAEGAADGDGARLGRVLADGEAADDAAPAVVDLSAVADGPQVQEPRTP
jgi:hypothetical protein